ncbi:hypothetical protein CH63R_12244 [Colletotrichum higginsianum IMI 349063]|uniref:Uncharacterized protein n=1 Tax=Colletotrichum higginsianum (strain IMI 349063) TaxID=759273 RepID=A0A1B7Y0J8_COLHI|nr:hypothetical protein CH63R_12244 [Colletotrichum higginsianum IMI 349063]OBR05541.1 hypothetical protein CH63R_12244 [Colletotrichum higginsianum IMI 349063]
MRWWKSSRRFPLSRTSSRRRPSSAPPSSPRSGTSKRPPWRPTVSSQRWAKPCSPPRRRRRRRRRPPRRARPPTPSNQTKACGHFFLQMIFLFAWLIIL